MRKIQTLLLIIGLLQVPDLTLGIEYSSAAVTTAPTISSISGFNGYVEVAFSAASGATNYDYSTDGGLTWTTRSPAGTWSPLTISGLTNGTSYSIKLRGRDSSGVGTASNAVSGTPTNRSVITAGSAGNEAFLQGKYVEIGVRPNGAFGSTVIPTGFHGNIANCLGFRVDGQKNGWGATTGSSPNFDNIDDGDYFCPGTPYEGWALAVGANATAFNNHGATAISGSISNLVSTSTEQKVDWIASSSSNGILVSQTSVVPNDGQSLHIDITLKNTTASTITDIYYFRGYDPDNATGLANGLSNTSTSTNTITSRGGVGVSAEVKSTFDSGAQVLLRSTDSNARAAAGSTLSCCTPTQAEPVQIWNATSPWDLALNTATTGDKQVGLSVKVASLAAGATSTFRISYVLTANEANSPSATTSAATNVDTVTTATLNASVNPNGAATTVEFEYGTDSSLTTGTTLVSAGAISGSTSQSSNVNISGLTRGTTYYFRVKATNSVGTSYGGILSFTPIGPPSITIGAASSIAETTTTLNAQVNAMGGTTSSLKFIYSTTSEFTTDTYTANSNPTSLSGNTFTSISVNISGLTGGVKYYFRVVAANSAGVTTSSITSFTTTPAPSATTNAATLITSTSATLNGSVNARGITTTLLNFSYSTVSDLSSGVSTINTTPSSSSTNGDVAVTSSLTGLTTGTTYYYRLNVTNANGTNSGSILSFTPSASPTVFTDTATVSGVTAVLNGRVSANGSTTSSIVFIYSTNATLSTDTATVSVTPSSYSGATLNQVNYTLSGLSPLTTYYYRIIATNSLGTSSGSILSFSTPNADVTAPTVVITSGQSSYAKTQTILVTLTFSESVTGLTASDLALSGTSASGWSKGTPTSITPLLYTILLSPSSASTGSLILTVGANSVLDFSNNGNTASSPVTVTILEPQSTLTLTSTTGTYLTPLRLSYTGGSGSGSIAFAAANGTATGCAITNGDSLTSTSAGTCSVSVSKAADATYALTIDTKTVTLNKALRTISVALSDSATEATYGTTVQITSNISAGINEGSITYSVGVSTGCTLSSDSVTITSGAGNCVITGTISAGSNFDSATSTYLVLTLLKARQSSVSIGNYVAYPNISTYPLNVYGGTTSGAITRTLLNAGTANCSLNSGMYLTATSPGTCIVQAVKAGDSNYSIETVTATIYWIAWNNNFASNSNSTPTTISLPGATTIIPHTYDTFTVTGYTNETGTSVSTIRRGSILRILMDGIPTTDETMQVTFGGNETTYFGDSGFAITSTYVQVIVPNGAISGQVTVDSVEGPATGASITITG